MHPNDQEVDIFESLESKRDKTDEVLNLISTALGTIFTKARVAQVTHWYSSFH